MKDLFNECIIAVSLLKKLTMIVRYLSYLFNDLFLEKILLLAIKP
jgi:hypothetical protein